MATSVFSLYSCCSLIIHLQLLFLFLRANGAPVDDICNQTKDPSLCLQAFGADERSATADMATLAQIASDTGGDAAGKAKLDVQDHLVNENDPDVFKLYLKCDTFYFGVLACFQQIPNDLNKGDYADFKKQAAAIHDDVDGCEALFNNSSPFASEAKLLGIFADAMGFIADALSQ